MLARMLSAAAAAAVLAVALYSGSALAQPELAESSPAEGDVIGARPEVIRVCYSEPINIEDFAGGFIITVLTPDNLRLGQRIAWQRDGICADVSFDMERGEDEGEWRMEWDVESAATGERNTGVLTFTVDFEQGTFPLPTPRPTRAPDTPPEPGAPVIGNGDSGPNVTLMVLLTLAAVAAAAVVSMIGYAVRQATGFWLHRPPPEGSGDATDHH